MASPEREEAENLRPRVFCFGWHDDGRCGHNPVAEALPLAGCECVGLQRISFEGSEFNKNQSCLRPMQLPRPWPATCRYQ